MTGDIVSDLSVSLILKHHLCATKLFYSCLRYCTDSYFRSRKQEGGDNRSS